MFSKEIYQQRRKNLLAEINDGMIIIPSYTNSTMSNDVHYEFRQQTDLLYFTGFPEPNTTAVIEKSDDKVTYTLFVPKRDKDFEIWNGRRNGVEGAKVKFGADQAFENEELGSWLKENMINYHTLYYPLGENSETDEIIIETMKTAIKSRNRNKTGPINLVNPFPMIHEIRAVKNSDELEVIKESAKISAEAMTLAMKVTKPGLTERQVEAVIEYYYAKNHASRPAYPSIVGSGVNATILHYIENSDTLTEGDLLLIDAGAEYKGYASDITRTWPVSGKFSDSQKEIYQLVLDVQEQIIDMVKPGLSIQDLHEHSVSLLSEGLIEFGLLEGDLDEIIDEEKYKRFYMHGIGHFLGMDVHDTSLVPSGRKYTLKEGHYFTVEPGIYIPDDEDIPEKYRGIGVRIEDDVLVTEHGCEVLTDGVVKSIDEIETIVGIEELP